MTSKVEVQIRGLRRPEIEAVLARNQVGRIAYARGNHIDIEPLSYVYAEGWIYGRTSPGRKLEMTGEGWWPVAFEVDETEGPFHWRSVVVHGGFYTLHPEGPAWEREAWARALSLLRGFLPQALTEEDPVALRSILFRIAVQEVTGREATPLARAPVQSSPG
jgi:nitroimidazol reductase NimA-like FMN-containing flavoprotein (pyridoxamine 5'-phosphate oxidase superfamily)